MKFVKYIPLLFIFSMSLSHGGYLIQNAKITEVTNTSGNIEKFEVRTNGGIGPCKGIAVLFTSEDSGSADVFNRAYSAALTAFAAGYNVDIYNYNDDDCGKAAFIRLKK